MKIKKIEIIISGSKCIHCNKNFYKNLETLKDYPDKEEVIVLDTNEMEYEEFYSLSSKYGFITVPMIVFDGNVVFRKYPTRRELLHELFNYSNKKCQTVDQEQIQLY